MFQSVVTDSAVHPALGCLAGISFREVVQTQDLRANMKGLRAGVFVGPSTTCVTIDLRACFRQERDLRQRQYVCENLCTGHWTQF